MNKLDLVDVGGGNIGSVKRCLERLEIDFVETNLENPPRGDRPVLLPGVGAFGPVIEHLQKSGFDTRLKELVNSGTPYLGICVGMQILFESSEESPSVPGLGLLAGSVRRFKEGKVPQIGWNLVELKNVSPDTKDYPQSGYVYFVNSFYPQPAASDTVLYESQYHLPFCAAVKTGNITAFQFHPEKSGEFGKSLLLGWLSHVA